MNDDKLNQNVFLSIVSHELKTPLTSISGFTQALQRKISQKINNYRDNPLLSREELEKYSDHLETIMRQINRLDKLMDDLLDSSVIESGNLRYEWDKVNLNILLEQVCEQMQVISPAHQIVLATSKGSSNFITGDENRLEKVFSNLLANAIKYSPHKDAITVDLSEDNDRYIISVEDKGIGIPLEDSDKIFDLYYRGKGVDNKKFSGLGLGLYLCKQIIDTHRGELTFKSEVGKGSIFYVKLPKQT
ncbi:MAG: HAMP domain-containing histidine kinase [bacterium]|nr:HAMP domain-containing histidine kinase [bacterium]